jgi:2-dehydro-3-deoxyphosphogluconate aldolase / (4S)-4-hydroxy-2-oxoglutarate aldolase
MERAELIRELHDRRLIAVIRSKTAEEAMVTARAAVNGGVKFVEITFSVPGALDVVKNLATEGKAYVGAGTVLSKTQAEAAINAGALFLVSPSLELDLIPICHEADVACYPGAATPTEVLAATRAGADLVKIFPADCLGGPNFIRQMAGPFPDVGFVVSGGVTLTNVKEYVHAGVTGICLGSAFLASALEDQGERGLVNEVREFVKFVTRAQAQSEKS